MSEEAHNARTAVPWAIVRTVGISSLIGWGKQFYRVPREANVLTFQRIVVNIVFAFCMGTDLQSIIDDPIGQPTATVSAHLSSPSAFAADEPCEDILQQLRAQWHASVMVHGSFRSVSPSNSPPKPNI